MAEMHVTRELDRVFDTLYIGGGTPSVLNVETIDKIIETAHQCFDIHSCAEITLEVNPGTVSPEKLKGYRCAGVNRINIGIQSFNHENLRFLERIHSERDAEYAVEWTTKAGFENIGLDLIYGIPGQTKRSWVMDLQRAVQFQPRHLSCYMLSFEPGTPMERNRRKGAFVPLAEQRVCKLFETTREFLKDHGYAQYEISNFAQERIDNSGQKSFALNRSRHNMKYWTFAPYIGLGPSAHSFIEPRRFWNHDSVEKYNRDLAKGKLPMAGEESLSSEQLMIEAVHLGLRQTEGVFIDVFDQKFGVSFKKMFKAVTANLEEKGLIALSQNRCALTTKGMLYLDAIASLFM